ncbi:MAG: peptidyl-prolyl cis-trans isomerase [Polyangiaceae bacterium]|nr:peptidyl-prolyl cis-trans isomerase [Polyangiaceae bacterium]
MKRDRLPRRWTSLARFFVAGALLFAVRQLAGASEPPRRPLVVEVAENADGAAVEAAIDEALLLDFATRAGWHRADPIVRERLVRSLEVADDAGGAAGETIERAIALGLHRRDPIARSRLVASARRALEATDADVETSLDEVRAAMARDPERYRSPARVRFKQVFLSFQTRGDHVDRDAAAVAAKIADDPSGVEPMSDPWPWSTPAAYTSTERLSATLGEGFGEALEAAPVGKYTGPIRSSFGLHFVLVEDRDDAHEPPAEAFRARVGEDLATARRGERLAQRLVLLRRDYDVTVTRSQ